ncbi:DUF5334 family protein [Candidatus Desulfovibrio trichonymphae]|uniref:Uncharacterized protein n=1 Tax=Candidatus Desulfovibrio trichonymphae TaxID=1725232 RepID=A0A1J1E3I7_9BACT|nr:DUF5334 family protein [Candidatus Desulfovibrio trichonymphae]BAV91984.1 conserved hypothetical protein [Candidatus Desulfovibrio trichonymphae]
MKHLLFLTVVPGCFCLPQAAAAWDGFDAATTNLVEITPDNIPLRDDTIDVRDYDTDATETCLVESVTRNARTVEVMVRAANGVRRILVMEGR